MDLLGAKRRVQPTDKKHHNTLQAIHTTPFHLLNPIMEY